ncbi:flavin reductase family protein [Rhizorhapis sp.]|uniref:flavin reductase family protein n=1 Tax=Rhizorhapis sp. TaxID=1968842 RepID=UPI002B48FCDB|nr:flavin reductase family protein [Rhizorhapis sp.]HKR16606.1 flavin reductase family protein [Rhizorhapis sp.]
MAADLTLADDFKLAMRRLATTIAIITTGKQENWSGMAATAVMSVTSEPPTILVAVNRNASLSPVLQTEQRFCVNLLAERHQELVGIFSGGKKGFARFETGGWVASEEGLPVLPDAVASLICTTQLTLGVATHTLFVGQVQRIVNHPTIDPLIWVDGTFASAQRI